MKGEGQLQSLKVQEGGYGNFSEAETLRRRQQKMDLSVLSWEDSKTFVPACLPLGPQLVNKTLTSVITKEHCLCISSQSAFPFYSSSERRMSWQDEVKSSKCSSFQGIKIELLNTICNPEISFKISG